MLCHLGALVPGKRPPQLLRQRRDRGCDGVADGLSAVARQRRTVVLSEPTVSFHAGQWEHHREPGGAFDQGPDSGAVQAHDEVPLPVPRDRPVLSFGRALADHDLAGDELLAVPASPSPRHSVGPSGTQAGTQLTSQRPPALDVEGLVDGLVRDPHRFIIREVHWQSIGDLLWTPRPCPASILSAPMTPADPAHAGARHGAPVRERDLAREPILHVLPQGVVRRQLRDLRAPGAPVGVPLRGCRSILQVTTTGGGIATQLSGDRRRRSARVSRRYHALSQSGHEGGRSPLALRRTSSGLTATQERATAPRHFDGTTGRRRRATHRPRRRPPRSTSHARSLAQNCCRCSRRATGGRPGDRMGGRKAPPERRRRSACPHCNTSWSCGVATTP